MASRIGDSLISAIVDCTVPGRVTGELRLRDGLAPVRLELAGDVEPDLAGRRVVLTNPAPGEPDGVPLTTEQTGQVVYFTLSHRHRLARGARAAHAPLRNVVHLEWTSATNGRVILSGGPWTVEVEAVVPAPAGTPPRPRTARPPPRSEPPSEGPMDEFDWERSMREADEMVDTYAQLERAFQDDPDKELRLAREMGWSWMEDPDVQRTLREPIEDPPADALPELKPNPATEGVDWIRTTDGDVRHPLAHRAMTFAIGLWRELHPDRKSGAFPPVHPDVTALQFNVQSLSAKLAGALNDVMYDEPPDGGFVTACLKRALGYLHQSVNTLELVARQDLLPADQVDSCRQTLLGLRQEIHRLMDRYRGRV